MVLGVHHDERAVLARRGHHVEDLLVVQPGTLVGHEDLEGAHPRADRLGQVLAQRRLVRVGDDQMKAVVDHRLGARTLVIIR